jgi:hypothetical protein
MEVPMSLDRESSELVDAARDGDDPSPDDRMRVRRRLVQLGVGAALTTAASGTAAATLGSAGGGAGATGTTAAASIAPPTLTGGTALVSTGVVSSFGLLALKMAAAVVLVGGVGFAGVKGVSSYQARHSPRAESKATSSVAEAPSSVPAEALSPVPAAVALPAPGLYELPVVAAPAAEPTPTIAERPVSVAPAVDPSSASLARSVSPPRHAAAASTAPASTTAGELRLLADAESLRVAGNPSRSLSLLDEYAVRFPNGTFAEEHAAQRVYTLCDLGRRAEATLEGRSFLREHPRSSYAERVRACASTPTP